MNIGEYVVYGGTEICRIDGTEEKCFDGMNNLSYYRLIPKDSPGAEYFVPDSKLSERTRPLLTREQILEVIDGMPSVKSQWINDKNERRSVFSRMVRSDDYGQILSVIKAMRGEQNKRTISGKRLNSTDEKVFTAAQKLLNREFAFVLGINEEDVDGFIRNRLGETAETG